MSTLPKQEYSLLVRVIAAVFVLSLPVMGTAAVIAYIRAVELLWELFH